MAFRHSFFRLAKLLLMVYLGVDDETRQPLTISESERHEWEEKLSQWDPTAF